MVFYFFPSYVGNQVWHTFYFIIAELMIIMNFHSTFLVQSLALAHANVENGKVVFVPWTETDFRTGEAPWWA